MTELLNIYKPDFDLFEYNSTKYLEMIRTESKSHELFHASTTHASHWLVDWKLTFWIFSDSKYWKFGEKKRKKNLLWLKSS